MRKTNPFRGLTWGLTLFCLWLGLLVGLNYVIHLADGFHPAYSAAMAVNAGLLLGLQGLHIVHLRTGKRSRAYWPLSACCLAAMLACSALGGRDFWLYAGSTELLLWGGHQLLLLGFDAHREDRP